ncbi:MAG: type IV secretion system protein [Alphaproteobacteria bacterium]|nr:type IV secretion system protein [Alphaproteobacteria bacterium]
MNTIEPPILMSRILTFVFATALATVVALVVTLSNILPLSKTQIFILTTEPRADSHITVRSYFPNDANIEEFKENFVREYIKVRNEIIPNINVMRRKWWTGENGMVNIWSSSEVYNAFTQTRMFQSIMTNVPDSRLVCRVEFADRPVSLLKRGERGNSTYEVNFKYFCEDNALQIGRKDYTIIIGIDFKINRNDDNTIKWASRLENPLGIFVSEYTVEGGRDPLDF